MSDLTVRIENLSPAKRKLLELQYSRQTEQVYPLSYAQQRLWLIDQMEPGSVLYNLNTALRLSGRLVKEILQKSLDEIVRRHEVLRTSFHLRDGVPVQKIASVLKIGLEEIDLSHLAETEREAEAERLKREEAKTPFELGRGPLLRVKLLRLEPLEHLLLVSMHHIVSDAWSMGIMVREFSHLYEAYAKREKSPLPELAIQYADFAVWQREWLQGEVLERQLGYWKEQLADVPVLELPTDYTRPRVMSHRGGSVGFKLGKKLTQQLKELGRRENATLFMGLLAAFQVVLGRYAGQQDVPVGTGIANRNRVEIEGLIGFFVNTLVLRTDLSGNPDFREVLARVRKVVLEAYENQDVPYEKLVEELAPPHDLSRSPLFQVALALQNTEQAELRLPGLRVARIDSGSEVAKFDLALVLSDGTEGVTGQLSYALDLFETSTAERLLTHLKTVLERMVADPGLGIEDISLLTEAEWRQVVVEWNDTAREIPQKGLHRLFEEHAKRVPRRVALECDGRKMTYGELNRRANQLGHYLRKAGVGPDVLVGLCVERSLDMLVGLLGILKAGGAYVPLDPAYPAERIRFMLEDTQIPIVVVQERSRERLSLPLASSPAVINLDKDWERIGRESKRNLPEAGGPQNLAYIIYTSGSTGSPKGVMVTHAGIAALSRTQRKCFNVTPRSRVLQFSTLNFDASVWEFVMGLTTGAALVLVREDARSGQALSDVLVKENVTHALFPPVVLETLNERDETALEVLISGGDEISGELAARWSAHRRLFNVYGPTETTVVITISSLLSGSRKPPIGFPILNTRLYVLDERMNPSPVGVPGELYIAGEGLSRGYLNRPDLTADRFIPDLFSLNGGERLYRTGDVVKWNVHGSLEFLGRRDQQVKVRGYRIETGEVEMVLGQYPEVKEAVVQVRADETAGKRLVAWVVPKDGHQIREGELRVHLQALLPEYMIPSAFVVLEALPVTRSGKVDRKALPAPSFTGEAENYEAPRDVQEEILCGIFGDILKLERVGIHDNFFERGGHSLLATQAIARVRSAMGAGVPLRALFESPTVAGLAVRIEQERHKGSIPKVVPIKRADRQQPLPLSFAQQRLWFVDQLEPGSAAYNMPLRLWMRGDLNTAALERSLDEIVRRHEVLRTSFQVLDGVPVQKIAPVLKIGLEEIDLLHLPVAEREAEAKRLMREEAGKPFDLGQGPLLRVKLLRLESQEHVLLVSMHHIVGDAWSMGIMVREFSQLYEAYARGEEPSLPELAIQYADFAVWQREWLQGEVLEQQLGYWKEQLAGVPVLELPTDYTRPRVMSHRGGSAGFKLGKHLTQQLKELGRCENATLFMGLLAAFQVVLGRYAGQHDVAVGTAIANRNRVEFEGLIGFFVNTLVLRTDLSGNPDFREVLARVRKVVLGAYENQDVPFEKLMEELAPLSPFQVGLALQNTEQAELRLPGLSVPRIDSGSEVAKFDLSLVLIEGAEGVTGQLSYALDLFEAGTAERLLTHLKTAVERMVADPGLRIEEVSLLTEAEWHHVVVEWNDTAREIPPRCVHELFEEQVERTPEGVALEYEGQKMSYRELNRRANQLAHYLRKLGVGPEVLVGLCVERCLETAVGLLGILKAGGAYVPLDPGYPAERLRFMLEDAQMTVVLTQAKLKHQLPHQGIVFCLDSDWAHVNLEPERNPDRRVTDTNPAYVIYTSGSTGRPKGVIICHRSVTNVALAAMEVFRIGAGSRLLQFVSISFDISVVDFMSVLLSGATIVLKGADVRLVGAVLDEILHQERITTVILPPSVLQTVSPQEFPLLEVLGVGGEVCPGELVRRWSANRRMINGWGPTETTVCSAFAVPLQGDKAPIGRPVANTQVYMLDERMEPVPTGLPGEMYIGGAGVARGYLNRPELTAERFVPNPFGGAGERMYRTGDLGRLGADGNLDFVARSDEQVKVRGHRIEPGEIEAALLQHSGVREAVVVAREDIPGDKRLVAYISSRPATRKLDTGELRQLLKVSLPEYMIPSAFVIVETLPLTPNGKVDRKALPAPDYKGEAQDYEAPRNIEEEILCGIYADLLKVDRVGIHDSFFERGGHSLLATQAVSRLRKAFDTELPLRAFFEAPTVAELAERVRLRATAASAPLVRTDRAGDLPLSYAQQRLWFISQLEPEGLAYNIPIGLRLSGYLDRAALQASLDAIVQRHEVLRTTFPARNGKAVQEISTELSLQLEVVDLKDWAEDEREAEARRLARIEAEGPFDLGRGPLLRVRLLQLGEQEHVLLVTMHHIVSDGWSTGIMVREFRQLYEAQVTGKRDAGLPELPIQYADFAAWQREWLQGEVLEEQLGYWRKHLADVPDLNMPTDHPRPSQMSHRGASANFHLPAELTEKLRRLGHQHGVTMFMTLLAGLQTTLSKYAGQQDVVLGTSIANRNREEIEGLIGFFVNTLVLRTDLSGNPAFAEVLQRARQTALEAYRHQDMPFERLVQELVPRRDLSRSPFFQIALVLQNLQMENLQLPGLSLSAFGSQHEAAKFDLSFMISERDGRLGGLLWYARDLFEKETMERLIGHFQLVLERMAEDPERRIGDVSLVTDAERRQMLVEWNRTEAGYPRVCVHELFEEQAARTPGLAAVVCEGEKLSYAELNCRANQLGHYLRTLGVGPEARVGLCMERSLEMVVGLLGILKAGGAYLPLDPKLPVERMAFMLQDSQAAVLLTQESITARLPASRVRVVCMDADRDEFVHESGENVAVQVAPENLIYLIYTSGSTGKPKAVGIEHRQVVNYERAVSERAQFKPGAVFALVSSLAADLGNTMVFPALCSGGTLHVIKEETALNARMLQADVGRYGIDHIKITPTHLRALLNGEGTPELLPHGRLVLGGEASSWDWVVSLQALRPQLLVMNHYGPTECTVGATTYQFDGNGRKPSSGTLPLGRPLSNVQVYVLDSVMDPVPVGVAGELYIGGAGVGRGYLDRPKLTAERFVPDAFSLSEGARLYRTGDRVKWLPTGDLEFLGRFDEQVKVRGFRIELGEIESALLDHAGVAQAVVVAREQEAGANQLVAYLVPAGTITTVELRDALKRRLPDYMVPSVFVTVDALPLMPNGKIDRRRLPEPHASVALEGPESDLQTPTEEMLAGIWSQVLRLERVDVADNFFELGGHSLLATQVIARVRSLLGVELPLRTIFEAPTLAGLAERIEQERQKGSKLEAVPMRRVDRGQRLPLSFAQQRLWFIDQLEPGSSAYNIPIALQLHGQLNKEALLHSLNEIVRRHEVLRTSFPIVNGEPVQEIAAKLNVAVEQVDLTGLEEQVREDEARRIARAEAGGAFDLGKGPLVRGKLLCLEEQEHVLLVTMHHIVSDGWSSGIIVREFSQLYAAYMRGAESPLPELKIQYADFAVWQREWLQGEVLQEQLEYWKTQLRGAALLELPTDRSRPAVPSRRAARLMLETGEELKLALASISRRQGTTLYMTLLAAFQTLLARYSGQSDVVVGMPIAGRSYQETEPLIGMFFNMLAVRMDLSGDPGFRELLGRARETMLAAYAHQDMPFERLVGELDLERDLSYSPLFQVIFEMNNTPREEGISLPGLRIEGMRNEHEVAKVDLTLTMAARGSGVRASLQYSTDLFDRGTMERMIGHYRSLLEGIAADPDQPLSELPMLSAEEREQVVVGWNSTWVDYGDEACMHDLFERQAEKTPEGVAVVCEGMEVSYGDLEDRANRLANYLRNLGVGPEVRVGICVGRSVQMVVGVLGILKAGGAYVPLDPAHPAERIGYMLGDAQVSVVLSEVGLLEKLQGSRVTVVCLDRQWEEIEEESGERPVSRATAENLAYIYYTSGSTGRPKGVAMAHSGIVNYIRWGVEAYEAREGKGAAVHSSIAVDLTLTNFLPLFTGQKMVLVEETPGVEGLVGLIQGKPEWSLLKVTPTHLTLLNLRLTGEEMRHCTRVLVIGADNLVSEPTLVWREQAPGVKLLNEYGPTETVVGCSIYQIGEGSPRRGGMPIGRPIANIRMYVLDGQGQPAPIGVPGELFIGGVGVARGYWGRPDLTAEKFLPDMFAGVEGARFYRTGDRARFLPDGNLEFLGRLDHQVKIRGYRIEPEEVEAVLSGCPGVQKAMVVVREDVPGEKRLVGYVAVGAGGVAGAGAKMEVGVLREYLKQRLPEYMVPVAWVILDELPVGSSGKINPKDLPKPEMEGEPEAYVEPRTDVERILSGIWAEVLNISRVGIHDNFFELGGQSLLATRVMSRLRGEFEIELPLRALFELPTVAGLAERVEREKQRSAGPPVSPITRASRAQQLPLSFAQQRLWFIDQLEPNSAAYNIPFGLQLSGNLNRVAVRNSLNEIVRRHEVLRTTFPTQEEGIPIQKINDRMRPELEEIDLTAIPTAELEAEIRKLARAEAGEPFRLAQGPLLRARLLRVGEQEHVLLVTMHHIVSDGWSMGILVREFSQLYEAYAAGAESPLAELAIQYADFAVWQQKWMQGEVLAQQLGYWKHQLAGLSILELPTDRPRPLVETHRGGIVPFELDRVASTQLRDLAHREGATLFMTLLAAFQVVLRRYTGQTDIAVGTDVANRNRIETEGLIGFFVNQLVLRAELSDDLDFSKLLGQVRRTTLEAYEHQDLPFEKLVEELQTGRDLGRSPLFQVNLTMQNAPKESLRLPGVEVRFLDPGHAQAKLDIELAVFEDREGRLTGNVRYAADLFDRSTISRLVGHLRRVLEGAVVNARQNIDEINLLTEEERAQIVADWNWTGVACPERCAHELFEERAAQAPGAAAVVYAGRQLTYRELNCRANQIAHYLRRVGVTPETHVGVYLERGPELVTALLGILKAGGVYLPLDPAYPGDRLAHMIQDAKPSVVISAGELANRMGAGSVRVVSLTGHRELIANESTENPGLLSHPENLAYVMYTSGSTGRPKGAMIEQRGMLNHLCAKIATLGLNSWDVIAQNAPSSFDISVWQVLAALLAGGRIYIMSDETARDAWKTIQETREHRVTVLETVPTMLAAMVSEHERKVAAFAPKDLRWLISNAEALPSGLCATWLSACPHAALLNTYGATECSDDTCHCHIRESLPEALSYAPLGSPIMNTTIYVLDQYHQPVPVGVAGELYIGGLCLGRGYLNQPGLTAQKFVPNPYSAAGGERLYRTGDRGRWRADGTLEFLGRTDKQVKIRGHRVELGEIETALSEHAEVEQAVVEVRLGRSGEKYLAGYVVPLNKHVPLDTTELRRYLQQCLPDYMVPRALVELQAFPLTPSGKLDRKALPEPEQVRNDRSYIGPRDGEEEILCGIFAEVLDMERVGIQDDFFELGGHSLLATQVISRVRRVFGIELPLRDLFEAPVISRLAERVRNYQGSNRKSMPPLAPVARTGALPLSYAQQRLWFIDQLEPGSSAYNIPMAVRLRGQLDSEALSRALNEIVRRHEVLRTNFPTRDGQPVQNIVPEMKLIVQEVDLSGLSGAEQETEAKHYIRAEAAEPFDLARGPLVRGKQLRLGAEEHLVLITMHHIVGDGWSTGIVMAELTRLYEAYTKGEESPLDELEIQYADFAVWQREWLQGQVLEEHLEYWTRQLRGAAVLTLPADRARPAVPSRNAARLPLETGEELKSALEGISRRAGTTLYMTLLAAFQTLLARYSGQSDVVVGIPIAGRSYAETESLIGMFFNVLAVRMDLSRDPGFRELLGRARETMLGAYAHQDLPFERLVAQLDLERDLSYSPLFQVIFEMNNTPRETGTSLPGLLIEGVGNEHEAAKVDLTLTMADRGRGVRGSLQYSTDLFDAVTMERMIGHYRTLLEGIAADPDQRLSELPMLSAEEREQVVARWNATAVEYEDEACMHELFERQVEKTPGRVAVAHEGIEVSYRELEERANRLANYLRKLNVGPEVRVGICVGRSLEMVVGLLGVLKAGGAYVPLDHGYPAERLGYMLGDSQASVVLTQARLLEKLPRCEARVVCLDQQWQEIGEESGERPVSRAMAENLAYIYYTSGSTGRPKGVAMAHSGIANYIRWGVEAYEAADGKGAAVHSSIAVDLTLTNLLPLFAGQKMVLAPDTPGVEGLVELIQAKPEWSLLKMTPTHLTLLNSRLTAEEMKHSTRVLVIGADNLVAEPTLVWREQAPGVKLLNEYGPTETVVGCSIYRIGEGSPRRGGMPIGKPIANMTMYVLDEHGHPAPIGVPGELHIGGTGVARGYWGKPDLTAEKFVPNPYGEMAGGRYYRTGDRARFLADGNLEFLGRMDHQVKIRGYRIEPAEVEAVLSGCPGVRKAMVVVREDVPGEKRLVGYVAVGNGNREGGPGAGELRQYLKERLPEYMVPAAWVVLDELPVGSSGKIDPRDLPRPEMEGDAKKYVEPRTQVEKILAGIWEEVLKVKQVGIHDNFFELGGDSILSIQIITRAREAGLGLQPRQMFERQTIAELAEVVGSESEQMIAEQGVVAGEVELTPIQRAFFEWGLVKPEHYNQSVLLEVKSGVDTRVLEEVIEGLVHQHDALRMRYEESGEEGWRQWCEAEMKESVYERKDLSWIDDESEQRAELERDAGEAQGSLNLKAGRVMKAVEYDLGGERGKRLLLIIHHLVVDGVSWRILLEDLERGYRQRQQGEKMRLGAKSTSYRQWAERLRQYGEEEALRQEMEYWSGEARKNARRIPRDEEGKDAENLLGTQNGVTVWLEEDQTLALLQDVPGVYQTQIDDVLLTALARVCGEWSGSEFVLVDVERDGRDEIFTGVDTSRTVGWFTTMYPVALEVGKAEEWEPGEALTGIKEQLRTVPRSGIGYGVLRYGSSREEIRKLMEELPQAEISFNYLGQVDQTGRESALFRLGQERTGSESAAENRRQHVLAVSAMIVQGKLQLSWRYSVKLHRRETIEVLAGRYLDCLQELIAHCLSADAGGFTPSDFDLARMTPAALRQVAAQLDDQ